MLNRLERIFRPITIPNLTIYLIIGQAMFFFAIAANPNIVGQMGLEANAILDGQVYRLIAFLFMPETLSPIWIFFQLYILWLMGRALEYQWGHTRFNLYIWIGYLLSIAVAFFVPNTIVYNTYLMGSIFLAFAFLFPDFEFLLFFILPVKVKWLALITWVLYAVAFLTPGAGWGTRLTILAAVSNFFVFFGKDIFFLAIRRNKSMLKKVSDIERHDHFMHKCITCGKTERTDPQTEFRYISEAGKTQCYCTDHLPGGYEQDVI